MKISRAVVAGRGYQRETMWPAFGSILLSLRHHVDHMNSLHVGICLTCVSAIPRPLWAHDSLVGQFTVLPWQAFCSPCVLYSRLGFHQLILRSLSCSLPCWGMYECLLLFLGTTVGDRNDRSVPYQTVLSDWTVTFVAHHLALFVGRTNECNRSLCISHVIKCTRYRMAEIT